MAIQTEWIRTRVSARVAKQLKQIAKEVEKPVSNITRDLLVAYVTRYNRNKRNVK